MEIRKSIPVFFTTIRFHDEEINKSRLQRVEEYLQDNIANETAHKDSLMYVSGIFSYKENAPVNRWLPDNFGSVLRQTVKEPTNWKEVY